MAGGHGDRRSGTPAALRRKPPDTIAVPGAAAGKPAAAATGRRQQHRTARRHNDNGGRARSQVAKAKAAAVVVTAADADSLFSVRRGRQARVTGRVAYQAQTVRPPEERTGRRRIRHGRTTTAGVHALRHGGRTGSGFGAGRRQRIQPGTRTGTQTRHPAQVCALRFVFRAITTLISLKTDRVKTYFPPQYK